VAVSIATLLLHEGSDIRGALLLTTNNYSYYYNHHYYHYYYQRLIPHDTKFSFLVVVVVVMVMVVQLRLKDMEEKSLSSTSGGHPSISLSLTEDPPSMEALPTPPRQNRPTRPFEDLSISPVPPDGHHCHREKDSDNWDFTVCR